jgi:hypothetical protein
MGLERLSLKSTFRNRPDSRLIWRGAARFGYARVSTREQNPAHQIDALLHADVPEQNIFIDKVFGKLAALEAGGDAGQARRGRRGGRHTAAADRPLAAAPTGTRALLHGNRRPMPRRASDQGALGSREPRAAQSRAGQSPVANVPAASRAHMPMSAPSITWMGMGGA